ncbi:MAG: hypothetical protein ACRD6N_00025, partial [Pyrinomonadaceae bacterium]
MPTLLGGWNIEAQLVSKKAMLFRRNYRFKSFVLVTAFFAMVSSSALAAPDALSVEAAKLLPDRIEDFRGVGPAKSVDPSSENELEDFPLADTRATSARTYKSKNGERLLVLLSTHPSESAAYSLLTQIKQALAQRSGKMPVSGPVDATSYFFPGSVVFSQGRNC